ncbi:MAG: hypothetical protein Q7S87_16045 [Agitococcus sp.]|nr:hypothetical protein [Agitococcus sp.]MDO9176948.1 hypothetical protein [Agitococcus sp.]
MDMRNDMFADQPFGKIALKHLASPDANFRLYKAGWLGTGRQREIMSVTGASFREALSGRNKGQLSIMIPHTSRSVHVTAQEMAEFEAKEQPAQ